MGANVVIAKDMTSVLKNAPVGEWIALSKDLTKVVGAGKTVEDALEAARNNGEESPVLTKVPPAGALIL
jgi:predicted RNase H-like HicB family nuclease